MRGVVLAVLTVGGLAAVAPPAAAFFAPGATPVSVSLERREQADDASQAVDLSTDGRFVVFQTQARNFFADDDPTPPGASGAEASSDATSPRGRLDLVAHGTTFEDVPRRNAARAHPRRRESGVSGDGPLRRVLDRRGARARRRQRGRRRLRARHVRRGRAGRCVRPRVRADGDHGCGGAVRRARGRGGLPRPQPGSEVTPGVALSDDGNRVAFRTLVRSDLPAAATPTTPAFQVLVRDRAARRTQLVTRQIDPADKPRPRMPLEPVSLPQGGPATLSADGTTVVWAGQNAPAQTTLLEGESESPSMHYLLWQRVSDEPGAPLREDVPTRG
jgi:hypothetical protein